MTTSPGRATLRSCRKLQPIGAGSIACLPVVQRHAGLTGHVQRAAVPPAARTSARADRLLSLLRVDQRHGEWGQVHTHEIMSLTCIVPHSVWHAQQALRFGPLSITTRMTVVRLRDASLWVHSPISPTRDLIDDLQKIGPVRYVVAPNKSHHLFFLAFQNAYPSAQGYVAAGLASKRPDLGRFPQVSGEAPWGSELQGFFIDGLPILNETVWFHADTGTLIMTDLLFCFSETNRGIAGLAARLLGVHGRLAMSRTMKLATRDRQALARSVLPLLSLPVQRVVVAHDQVISEHAMDKLTQAFAWLW